MFEIQTKENKALENSGSGNIGLIKVFAPSHGVISTLSVTENGAYMVEGAPLCTVAESNEVLVQLNLPFEYNSLVKTGTKCTLVLGEDTKFDGTVYQILPTVDEANQTQQILIKPHTNKKLPENLNLAVEILKSRHNQTCLVPRDAVMTNETQTEFWVMKLINPTTAVKIPVKEGIQAGDRVEILSPSFTKDDKIVVTGNYGLPDTAKVKIIQQ